MDTPGQRAQPGHVGGLHLQPQVGAGQVHGSRTVPFRLTRVGPLDSCSEDRPGRSATRG